MSFEVSLPDLSRYLDPLTIEQLAHLRPAARRGLVDGVAAGGHRGRPHGVTAEFRQHRPYVPGDEPRRLDWRVLARTGRPYVRQTDALVNRTVLVVLDTSGSMGYADKWLAAGRLVAAVAHLMLAAGEAVGLHPTAGPAVPPRAGPSQLARLLDAVDRCRPAGPAPPWAATAATAVARLRRRSAVVVVTDALAPVPDVRSGLSRLRQARHDVALLRLLHADERTFHFRGPVQLQGMEGERPTTVNPAVVRAAYLKNAAAHARGLSAACRSLGVRLIDADPAHPVARTVARLLSATPE